MVQNPVLSSIDPIIPVYGSELSTVKYRSNSLGTWFGTQYNPVIDSLVSVQEFDLTPVYEFSSYC